MSELVSVWNNTQLAAGAPPPSFRIDNNPNARSLKINNQSRYWLLISKTQSNIPVDRMEPFSYLTLPYQPDLTIAIDTLDGVAPISSLAPDHQFVDYSTINGVLGYAKGSTQFSGSANVSVDSAQISMTATNVTVNNDGMSASLTDASSTIASANAAQTILSAQATRKYFFFQNLSDTDMYLNFGSVATIGAGSMWIQAGGGAMIFENKICPNDSVSVICSAAGKGFTCKYVIGG